MPRRRAITVPPWIEPAQPPSAHSAGQTTIIKGRSWTGRTEKVRRLGKHTGECGTIGQRERGTWVTGTERLRPDGAGLVAAVVQQYDTGEVLMLAWMDEEALRRTLATGRATYWSRSRKEY